MKIILLKDIPKIGKKNEIKEVSDGYALNFVIPRGLGIKATPDTIKKIESLKQHIATEQKIHDTLLAKTLENLSTITITISEKANDKGHLFAGIDKERVVKEIEKASGTAFETSAIELPKPIKETGEYIISIASHGKRGKVKVVVNAA